MIDELVDPTTDPRALRVRKQLIPVHVAFAGSDGVCQTLEGAVRYRAGDAILTGTRGEQWPVRRELFFAGYAPVPPTRVAEDGIYVKAPSVAHAYRLDRSLSVRVGWRDDPLVGHAGDWLLRYEDGSHGVVQDTIFRESYGPAPGETRWPPPR